MMARMNNEECISERLLKIESVLESMSENLEHSTKGMEVLVDSIRALSHTQEKFTKWLLVVVCVIALGRGLLEIANDLLKKISPVAAIATPNS